MGLFPLLNSSHYLAFGKGFLFHVFDSLKIKISLCFFTAENGYPYTGICRRNKVISTCHAIGVIFVAELIQKRGASGCIFR